MSFFTRFKGVIIGGAVIIIAFFAYSYFFAGTPEPVLSGNPSATVSVDQDLLGLLLTLKGIELDNSLFADSAFQSLQDFSQALVSEPIGRLNPFAPLGASVSQGKAGTQAK